MRDRSLPAEALACRRRGRQARNAERTESEYLISFSCLPPLIIDVLADTVCECFRKLCVFMSDENFDENSEVASPICFLGGSGIVIVVAAEPDDCVGSSLRCEEGRRGEQGGTC